MFFEIEVLDKYFNDPRYDFSFEDYSGRISCVYDENDNPLVREEDQIFLKTFGLGFDANDNRLAVVYLRYLHDLTREHQIYWKSKEVKSSCKVLEEYHENCINGNWAFSYSIFTAFLGELNTLRKLSKVAFDKEVFRKSYDRDNRPKEFTFFFIPTLRNYNEFVHLLDKMISENINKDFFNGTIELFRIQEVEEGVIERIPKGTLQLFEEWLLLKYKNENKETLSGIFKPLKRIRKERQKPAHRINENIYDKKYTEMQKELINEAYNSIQALRMIFQRHRKTKDVEIPDWLDEGSIKMF